MKAFLLYMILVASFCFTRTSATTSRNEHLAFRIVYLPIDTPSFRADVYTYGRYTPIISPKQLQFHTNERVFTQGKVFDAFIDPKSNAIILKIGVDSPGERVTIIIKEKYRTKFDHPEANLIGKTITVLGWVTFYKGDAAMKLGDPKDLQISVSDN